MSNPESSEILSEHSTIVVVVDGSLSSTQLQPYIEEGEKIDGVFVMNNDGLKNSEASIEELRATLDQEQYRNGILVIHRDIEGLTAVRAVRVASMMTNMMKKGLTIVVIDGKWDRAQGRFIYYPHEAYKTQITKAE